MESVHGEGGGALLVHGGNLLFHREQLKPEQYEPARLRADLILDAYRRMGCAAFNVGAYDLSLGIDYLLRKAGAEGLPFISANLADHHGRLLFPPSVIVEVAGVKVGVFGLIDDGLKRDKIPGGHKITVLDPEQVAAATLAGLRAKGAEVTVLITDLTTRTLRKIAAAAPLDVAIGSDNRNRLSLPIVVNDTLICHLDRGGKVLGRLDLLLPPFTGPTPPEGDPLGSARYRNRFVSLSTTLPADPGLETEIQRLDGVLKGLQEEAAAQAPASQDSGCAAEYVGVTVCARCHADRHRTWLATRHARASATLEREQRQFDEQCAVCHTLAYECDAGAMVKENLSRFTGVQCESCHGPGNLHVEASGTANLEVDRSGTVCLRCHTPDRTDPMDFPSRFREICGSAPQ